MSEKEDLFQHVKTTVRPLTRRFAEQFDGLATYDGDRQRDTPQGRARIRWLEHLLETGRFHTPKWATARMNGTTFRVNGGHSCKMLLVTNLAFPADMQVVLDEFMCSSHEGLAYLFDQFDNARSTRTMVDKTNAHKVCEGDLVDVRPAYIQRALGGLSWYLTHVLGAGKMSDEGRVRLIHQYPTYIKWAEPFVKARTIARNGVVAAMFATSRIDREAATDFWTHVKGANHPDHKNPTRTLAGFLRDCIKAVRAQWPSKAYYAKSIHAWNAWREGRPTNLRYHPKAPLPVAK